MRQKTENMKNIIIFLLITLLTTSLYSQENTCIEDFENQAPTSLMSQVGNWEAIAGWVAFEADASTNGTMVLRGADGSGSSWMSNATDYAGEWETEYCELCFDIRYVAGPNNPPTGVNAVTIYQNPTSNPTNTDPGIAGGISSRFQVVNPIGPDWVQVCVPIALSNGGVLPSNSYGQWMGSLTAPDWDNLIQNVSGIAFRLDFSSGNNPAEDVFVDNLCFVECEAPCAIVTDEELICDANGHSYTFNIQNNSGVIVDGIIVNQDYDPNVVIQPGGTYGPSTINIPPGTASPYCFDIIMFSEDLTCCHYEHCIDIPECNPCDSIYLEANRIDGELGECCYTVDVTNNFDDQYFTKITSTILTNGVNFDNPYGANGWTVNPTTGNTLTWTPGTPYIDDIFDPGVLNFCLIDITQTSQTPQYIKFDWITTDALGQDSIACSDTLIFECETCLEVSNDEIVCLPNGDYSYCVTIDNNDPINSATEVYFDVYEPVGLQFNPTFVPVNLPPLGSASVCVNIPGPLPTGTEVKYKTILKNFEGDTLNWCCIVDTFSVVIPECEPDTCPTIQTVDIECGGDLNQDGIEDYIITITATGNGTIDLSSSCGTLTTTVVPVSGFTTATTTLYSNNTCPFLNLLALYTLPNGTFCGEELFEYDFPFCGSNEGCLCDLLGEDVFQGFNTSFDCPQGTYTPNSLEPCDEVSWYLNNILIGTSVGNEAFTFEYEGPGDYFVCMFVTRFDDEGTVCTSFACLDITITDWCPEIPQPVNQIKAYPNPGKDVLNIATGGIVPEGQKTIQITDMNGKVLFVEQTEFVNGMQVNIETLQPGMYFLTIEGKDNFREVLRFVKTSINN